MIFMMSATTSIIQGLISIWQEEWPSAYWKALKAMTQGEAVDVPRSHPKFDMSDMARIAAQGPRFADVVAHHAERVDSEEAMEYSYVPRSVLGDWTGEVEPRWTELEQVCGPWRHQ